MAADPEGKFSFLIGNYLFSFYRVARYDTLRILLSTLLPDESTTEETESLHEFYSWLESGDLDNVPLDVRPELLPVDWLRFGYPDSAAAALTEESQYAFDYNQLYEFWDPVYDPIRLNPRMQAFLRRVNLEGATPDRTPPGAREVPAPLRGEQP
jgi:hypothetical protein